MRSSSLPATMRCMKQDTTAAARLDVLQAAIEAMFEALRQYAPAWRSG